MNSITNEIVIASISDGIIQTDDITRIGNFTPCIVGIVCNYSARCVNNAHDVALQILYIIVLSTIIDKGVGTATLIIEEIHVVGSPSLTNEQAKELF